MTFSSFTLFVIIGGAVLLTALLVYLIMKQQTTGKKEFAELQQNYFSVKSTMETEQNKNQTLINEQHTVKEQLQKTQEEKNSLDRDYSGLKTSLLHLQDNLKSEKDHNEKKAYELDKRSDHIIDLNHQLTIEKANNANLLDKMENQQKDFEQLKQRSLLEFKQAANTLLEEKSERFAKINQTNIEQILKPLGENLHNFKKQVEETYDKESKQRFSLEEKIKELVKLNNQISEEANNLTNALKGQSKTQGDWGEMILENILEFSGLSKNREYFVQDTFRDEQGNIKKPDVIIKYPDQRFIIVDSKVSLVAYERLNKTTEKAVFDLELAAHMRSIRSHIDDLSSKEYDKFDKTLDFVMLFVPIEPAYLVAMQHDPELWNYAYSKRILLISPTNLIAALKMVADIWKRDDQNRNAREIAKRGEMLYDKFVGFVSEMENIDKYISKADESYKEAMSKLRSGRGNLISQAEKLRKLGLKPKKTLPDVLKLQEEE